MNLKESLKKILRDPKTNLTINFLIMIFQFGMAIDQWVHGDHLATITFIISGLSCITAIAYWILVAWAKKKEID